MKKIKEIIKKRFDLIASGNKLKDKFLIFAWIFVSLLNFNLGNKLIKIKNEDGKFICRGNFSDLWCISPWGEKDIRKYFEKFNGGTFIDIGANIGKYTIMLGKNANKVIAIEPEPNNFKILKKNIKKNKLKNVIALKIACSNKDEKADFYVDKQNTGYNSLNRKTKDKITIKTRKLDNLLKELKIKKIDLIKIDVEGAEKQVLEGGIHSLKKYKPKIIFEAWNKNYLNLIKKILLPLGYNIKQINDINYYAC